MDERVGTFNDLSNTDYHADPAPGHGNMVQLLRSGLHYITDKQSADDPTEAMGFGLAAHWAILETDKFFDRVAIQPPDIIQRRGKKWDKFVAENPGKIIIKHEHEKYGFNVIKGIVESLKRPEHSTARTLLSMDGIIESSIFWVCPTTGVRMKIRPDKLIPKLRCIIDFKTTTDASQTAYPRAASRFGYDIQAALYLKGMNESQTNFVYTEFVFVFVEVMKPHAFAVYRAPDAMLETGRQKIRFAVERYQESIASGRWAGYPDKIIETDWPIWAQRF